MIGPTVVQRLRASYPTATIVGLDMGYFAACLTAANHLPECRVDEQMFVDVRSVSKKCYRAWTPLYTLPLSRMILWVLHLKRSRFDVNHHCCRGHRPIGERQVQVVLCSPQAAVCMGSPRGAKPRSPQSIPSLRTQNPKGGGRARSRSSG